ncbi:MAG: hypothetical protein FWB99_07730 [Treponema sp.]|nr:hypothetical protein [Treponema sp.]
MMMQKDYWKIPAVVFCLAFGLVSAGCGGSGSPAGDRTHTPSWSGPHRLAAFDAFDGTPDIVFGNGRFFAVGYDNEWNHLVKTSTNGRNWSITTVPLGDFAYSGGIAYGGGRFLAFGQIGEDAYGNWYISAKSSTNGTTWTDATEDFSDFNWIDRIVYSGGRFFVFGWDYFGNRLLKTSTDGISWEDVTSYFNGFRTTWGGWRVSNIVHGAGAFFATGWDNNWNDLVISSTNGTSWENVRTSLLGDFNEVGGIVFGGGRFFAVGWDSRWNPLVKTSTNGTTWTDATEDFSDYFGWINRIVYSGGRFFVFGEWDDGYDWSPLVKSTTNGTSWSAETFLTNNNLQEVHSFFYDRGRTFVFGWDDNDDFVVLTRE